MTDDFRSSVFISHSWQDKQLAHRMSKELQRSIDVDVWIDFHELLPGDPIQATIDAALAKMDVMIVLWTPHSAESQGVQAEIATALAAGVRVVPAIVEYDDDGNARPPLSDALRAADVLGVNFHHFATGMAQLAHLIVTLEARRLPDDVPLDVASRRMVRSLHGYLEYLANYRQLAQVDDSRAYWVEQIIEEIERFVRAGGDVGAVRALLEAARRSDVDDPEGIGMLVTRLDALLGAPTPEPAPAAPQGHPAVYPTTARIRAQIAAAMADEEATGRCIVALRQSQPQLSNEQVVTIVGFLHAYIQQTPDLLEAMSQAAMELGVHDAIQPVIDLAAAYFDDPNDLVPDGYGLFGLLDDTYFAQRFVETISLQATQVHGRPLVDVDLADGNELARTLLGADIASALDARIAQALQRPEAGMSTLGKVALAAGVGAALLMLGSAFSGGGNRRDPNTEAEISRISGGIF